MQRDVKIGLIIGVVILALVVIVWAKYSGESGTATAPVTRPDADFIAAWESSPGAAKDVSAASSASTAATTPAAPAGGTTASAGTTAPAGAFESGSVSAAAASRPAAEEPRKHVVREGDTLWKLAEQYYGNGAKANLIAEANRATLGDASKLRVGQTLIIPKEPAVAKAVAPASPSAPTTLSIPAGSGETKEIRHTIAKNDNLWALAQKYYGDGSKWKRILEANRDVIKDERNLPVGKVITIPMDK